jgi:hypothetical protein
MGSRRGIGLKALSLLTCSGSAGWRTVLAAIGDFLIIVKLEDHDIRVPILGMGCEVSSSRCIRILFVTPTNPYDLPRAVLSAPLLDHQVNCVRKPTDE